MKRIDEIPTLTHEERQMLDEVKQAILRHLPRARVLLYGSAARGERGPESDYDVLVLNDGEIPREVEEEARGEVYDLELSRDVVVSTAFYSDEEWSLPLRRVSPYRREVDRDGVLL